MNKKGMRFLIIALFLLLIPVRTYALNLSNNFYILADCRGILGDPNNDTSVAWLVNKLLDLLRIIGPLIVVVLSSFDFASVIVTGDDESMAKAKKKLMNRLIFTAALFFLPTLVKVILNILGITGNATCGII